MTGRQAFSKRAFDLAVAAVGIIATLPITIPAVLAASIDTRKPGLFIQERVGRNGKPFPLLKVRTMRPSRTITTSVTTADDPRVTRLGSMLRRVRIDELPQLVNVVAGHMSFVGPRPDVPGFADRLEGDDRIVLTVRPGITGPATLKYHNEAEILAAAEDPEAYNRDVIFPDKVAINRAYVEEYSFRKDLGYLARTLRSIAGREAA